MAWYYAHHGIRKGPVAELDFDALVQAGGLAPDTLVWRPGMPDWVPLHTVVPGMENLPPMPVSMARPAERQSWKSTIKDTSTKTTPILPVMSTARITTSVTQLGQEAPYQVDFQGTTWGYFRIWIVNVLLTVLTCGVYAAWAKVRTRRYFLRQTLLDGQPFEFEGNPVAMLFGHVLIAGALGLTTLAFNMHPVLGGAAVLGCALVYPWFAWKSHSCRVTNTGYLGMRFGFHGTVAESYKIHFILMLLVPLTLGAILPYVWFRRRRYFLGHIHYGNIRFDYQGQALWYVTLLFKVLALNLAMILLAGLILLPIALLAGLNLGELEMAGILGLVALAFCLLFVPSYYGSRTFNHTMDNTTIGPRIRLVSNDMQARELLRLHFGNVLAVLFTLGLAIPWVKIRMARYRASRICLLSQGGLAAIAYGAIPTGDHGMGEEPKQKGFQIGV